MTQIKFCGLTRPDDARLAAEIGADYVGVILASGVRRQSPERAREIFEAAGRNLKRVIVLDLTPQEQLEELASRSAADILQLQSPLAPGLPAQPGSRRSAGHWAVVGVDVEAPGIPPEALATAEGADAVVVDSRVRGKTGGTGRALPWAQLSGALLRLRSGSRLVLAGGLTPENVAEAIRILAPDVVDVSSGIESAPGIKDPKLMRAFANAVRSASIG